LSRALAIGGEQVWLKTQNKETNMPKKSMSPLAREFVDTSAQISDAVDAGRSPAEPEIAALLNSIVTKFNPGLTVGDDMSNVLFSKHASLNYVNGLGGNDALFGSGRTDVLVGGAGNDSLFSFNGDDGVFGGAGHDWIFAGNGNDVARGGAGDDRIRAGSGNDDVTGGTGNDVMTGGAGADRFYFNPARADEGQDRITDFELGTDKIVLKVADVLESTPGLLALTGDPLGFEPGDLDASDLWNLGASHDGDLVVYHPTGSIEIDGFKFSEGLSFGSILSAIDLI
jgi:Ca2+-binding RTX toxin-like protein